MSSQSRVHEELLPDGQDISFVRQVASKIRESGLPRDDALFCVAVSYISTVKHIAPESLLLDSNESDIAVPLLVLRNELSRWLERLRSDANTILQHHLSTLKTPIISDFLGVVYQTLRAEGEKSNAGAYFTPPEIARSMILENIKRPGPILDPCCGTGNFLLEALSVIVDRGHPRPLDLLVGVDIDPIATSIARVNLVVSCPDELVSEPNVVTCDAFDTPAYIEDIPYDKFAYIFSNPPWGANKNRPTVANEMGVASGESFSQFLALGLALLQPKGRLSFVLPESILNIRTHADIRKLLLSRSSIVRIRELGRAFSGVFTPTLRLDIEVPRQEDSIVQVIDSSNASHNIAQSRFEKSGESIFDIYQTASDAAILEKMEATPHFTLAGRSKWALGVVTGNNKKYIENEAEEGLEPILRGKDILLFSTASPSSFIKFNRALFQQVAANEFYRAPEKLIYKFIAKYLCFAYDNKQTLTLNSANILIPSVEGISIKCVLALLNSLPIQFYFQKKYAPLKVLRSHIEDIPLPYPTDKVVEELESLVESITSQHAGAENRRLGYEKINEIVMNLFDMNGAERDVVRGIELPKNALGKDHN